MRVLFSRPLLIVSLVASLGLIQPAPTHAGMLGDLWGSIVGFFTGKKKVDAATEDQIKTLLESTNNSQNELIATINEILAYQKSIKDLNNPSDKDKIDNLMQSMQQSIQKNQDNFLQLMQTRQQLEQSGQLAPYESNFQQFILKQQEIEGYYPKIEDRYNELAAFSDSSAGTTVGGSDTQGATGKISNLSDPWDDAAVQAAIDKYLETNGLDEWGGPRVENAKIGRPPGAGQRSRYQYVWEANPAMREALGSLIEQTNVSNQQTPESQVSQSSPDESSEVVNGTPASPKNSATKPSVKNVRNTNMAFTNRYDNVDIRNQRKSIYKDLMKLQNEGRMDSEEYKDLYHQYTLLGQKLNGASQ